MNIAQKIFGHMPNGEPVQQFTLTNSNGVSVDILEYGAIIRKLNVPDTNGKAHSIVLGYDTLERYLEDTANVGCIVGRVANRIAGGSFEVDGRRYQLDQNEPPNHLHGGFAGLGSALWRGKIIEHEDQLAEVRLTCASEDGAGGYPGCVELELRITLSDENDLTFGMRGTTDQPTILNLTRHDYFNLSGSGVRDIHDHLLQIYADVWTPTDKAGLPTGEIVPVDDTPLDFRREQQIGPMLDKYGRTLTNGYDHNFAINGDYGRLRPAARLSCPASGRILEISTTQPGMMLYTAGYLSSAKNGFAPFSGICLETQHFPDAPNHPSFQPVVVTRQVPYQEHITYRLSVEP